MSPLALSIRFLQSQPDERLIELARAGHERAFEALVRRYRRALLAYSRRVAPLNANAEDTLQQALLQAWTALGTGAEVRDARAWLYRIVHNVAVSDQRRPQLVPGELHHSTGTSSAHHVVEQRLAVREALAGLAALPHLQREVMVGTAVDGMSHEEVATALGLSSGAVRGLIYRARAALRSAAAALIPSPLVEWVARQGADRASRSAGWFEAVAGGGSAGLGGAVLKSGAVVVVAGALATAAGIGTRGPAHPPHRLPRVAIRPEQAAPTALRNAPVAAAPGRPAIGSTSRPALVAPAALVTSTPAPGGRQAGGSELRSHSGSGSGSPERGSPQERSGPHDGMGSPQTGSPSSSGSSGGMDGGSGSGAPSGSQQTTISGSHDGGGTDGGSSGGGGSDGGTNTTPTGGTVTTSGSDGSDGGSHDGGSVSTTPSGSTSTKSP